MKMDAISWGAFLPGRFCLPPSLHDAPLWPVLACDQFTQQPSFWQEAQSLRQGTASALHMVYPEAFLLSDSQDAQSRRIEQIHKSMADYEKTVLTRSVEGCILVERQTGDGTRLGLLGVVDLEAYSHAEGARSPIRPTEDTVTDRLPVRTRVRKGACLECAHVLLLADDPGETVVEAAFARHKDDAPLYDFDLPEGCGHIRGFALTGDALKPIAHALARLREHCGGLELAVGDGNHSLAAARLFWEELRPRLTEQERRTHPARYAMAELVNLYSPALRFHAIHRCLFGPLTKEELIRRFSAYCQAQGVSLAPAADAKADLWLGETPFALQNRGALLPLSLLQAFLDRLTQERPALSLDYIHGTQELARLSQEGALPIRLPAMDKSALFPAVRLGPLPRKTFSLGGARDKRVYLEARRLLPSDSPCKEG